MLSALIRRHDLPAEFGGWITGIKGGLEPSWEELAGSADAAPAAYIAAAQFGNDGAPVNLQDALFVVHVLHHFLEQQRLELSEPARNRALGGMVKLIKVYLLFLELVPTVEEQKSVLLEMFVDEYGDSELQSIQSQYLDNDELNQLLIKQS